MDRTITYPAAIPEDTDILKPQQNAMVALGALAAAVLGSSTVVDGLACTPGLGLTVQLGPGTIFTLTALEQAAYGSLPADTADSIVKVGINTQVTTSTTLAAPATAGQAINYLIQAQFQESDGGATVLPYYNAANPAVAYSGPGGSGTAQNTVRTQRVALQFLAGAAAAVGTQGTPAVTAGWTGIYIVTVNNGAVALNSGNITPYPGAPFVPTKLPMQRRKLTANLTLYVAATGNDANSGQQPWNAFATMQAAWNYVINSLDLNGFGVTISIGAGTFSTPLLAAGLPPGYGTASFVAVTGSGVGATTVAPSTGPAIQAIAGAILSISAMTLSPTGAGNHCVYATGYGSQVMVSNVTYSASAGYHNYAVFGGLISLSGSYSITGSAQAHLAAQRAGQISVAGITVTLFGTPVFSTAYAEADNGGIIYDYVTTFTGTGATGPRYAVLKNAVIDTNGAGAGFFPGNTAGSATTGGQYI